jgi:integrase
MKKQREQALNIKGCICQKKTSPYYYTEITYKLPDGEERRISRSTKCTRKYEAMRRMDEIIKELEDEMSSMRRNPHELTQFIRHWLEKVEVKEIAATTMETYRIHYSAYIQPYFEPLNMTVEELRPMHLWAFVEHMQTLKANDGSPLKVCTIKKVLSNIKLAMDYAVKMEIIEMNPAEPVKLKTKRKEKFAHSFYTIDQLMKLWRAAKGTIFEPAIVLASVYGLRRGEVSGLKWSRVDFERRNIHIEEAMVYAGSKPVIKDTKTEASMRTMPMISPVRTYLLKALEEQRQKANKMGRGWADSGYVVVDDLGEPIRPIRLSNNFRWMLAENGLPHIRFHDLRHSVATYMLSMGVPIADISAWLGHKSVSTTSDIYAHVTDEMRKDAARWMDAGYDPDDNGAPRMTLETAIRKLFENVLDNEDEAVIITEETRETGLYSKEQQKHQNEQRRNHEEIEEKPRFRVIRGISA